MLFDPYAGKLPFEPFTVVASVPCPKCGCNQALIAPTNNTHAASSRCANHPDCKKFHRWLGKSELKDLIYQEQRLKEQADKPDAKDARRAGIEDENRPSQDGRQGGATKE